MVLLRGSGAHSGQSYDFAVIMDGGGDGGVPHGKLLMDFGAAVVGERPDLTRCRDAVRRALGEEALADAAGVVAIFNAVVRVADATGTPLEDLKEETSRAIRADIGIDDFDDGKS